MRRRAFTLVELLVVIAVLALLMAILLPALRQARTRARDSACASNIRQLGVSLQLYVQENRGYYPGDHWSYPPTQRSFVSWAPRIRRYASGSRDVYVCPSLETTEARWDPPSDWTGEDVTWLGYAPGERPLMGDPYNGQVEYFSYGYNAWGVRRLWVPQLGLGGLVGEGAWAELRESRIRNPADMIALGDTVADGTWDTLLTPEPMHPTSWPGRRHREGANILFADGHLQTIPQERLLRLDPVERRRWNNDNAPHPEHWFPMP